MSSVHPMRTVPSDDPTVKSGVRPNAAQQVLARRLLAMHPTLVCDPSVVWDYGLDDLEAIEIGQNVSVHPFARIVVRHHSVGGVEGRLILDDQSYVGSTSKVVARGGTIRFGKRSGVAQHCIVVCGMLPFEVEGAPPRDAHQQPDIELEDDVWVGSTCVLLPGTSIGAGAVVAAGSVVAGRIPPGELWAGNPVRRIRSAEQIANDLCLDAQ
jgi:virginiamycin A acetyltransferase